MNYMKPLQFLEDCFNTFQPWMSGWRGLSGEEQFKAEVSRQWDSGGAGANMEQDTRCPPHPAFINTCQDQVLSEDRVLENLFIAESFYVKSNRQSVPHFLSEHRRLLTEWMLDVCQVNQNSNQVFLSAVSLLDKITSLLHVKSSQLQGLAAACLCISSKIRDPRPLTFQAFLGLPGLSLTSLQDMELTVLARLGWDLASPTSLDFLLPIWSRISRGDDFPKNMMRQIFRNAETFLVLAATESKYCQRNPSLMVMTQALRILSNWQISRLVFQFYPGTNVLSKDRHQTNFCWGFQIWSGLAQNTSWRFTMSLASVFAPGLKWRVIPSLTLTITRTMLCRQDSKSWMKCIIEFVVNYYIKCFQLAMGQCTFLSLVSWACGN